MQRHYLTMSWRDALFAHWPVDAEIVDSRLPAGVSARTHNGTAWLGIVGFVMADIRPRGVPRQLGLTFGEANLRTYATGPNGGEGIYFYNLDAADRIGVPIARQLYQLPYYRAHMEITRRGDLPGMTPPGSHERRVDFASHRTHAGAPDAHIDARYGPAGERFVPEQGTLEQFLVENYRFYLGDSDVERRAGDRAVDGDSSLFYGDVAHPPWGVYEAEFTLRSTNFFEANGFERPETEPLAHYSPGVPVKADRIRHVE